MYINTTTNKMFVKSILNSDNLYNYFIKTTKLVN